MNGSINRREQTRLRKARENGYLDARCPDNRLLLQAFGMWCWRLKLPMVWLERRTRYSRYAQVKLEMFTTDNHLNQGGRERLAAVCAPGNRAGWTDISAHQAAWDHVTQSNARELARVAFRAAIYRGNYEKNEVEETTSRKSGKVLQMQVG
jgi:hypothetical protein